MIRWIRRAIAIAMGLVAVRWLASELRFWWWRQGLDSRIDWGVMSGRPARALNGPAPMRRPSAGWGDTRGSREGPTSATRATYPNEWGVRTTPLSPAETAAAIAYERELAAWAIQGVATDPDAARAEALAGLRRHLTGHD